MTDTVSFVESVAKDREFFTFILESDVTNVAFLMSVKKTDLKRYSFIESLCGNDVDEKMKSSHKKILWQNQAIPVVTIPLECNEIEKLRDVTTIKLIEKFTKMRLAKQNFVKQAMQPVSFCDESVAQWLRLMDFFSCSIEEVEKFIDNVLSKLLAVQRSTLLHNVIQHLFVTNLYEKIIEYGLVAKLDEFVGKCIAVLIKSKSRNHHQLQNKLVQSVIRPLFELLKDWETVQPCSVTIVTVSSLIFIFLRRFWMMNPILKHAPNVSITATLKGNDSVEIQCSDLAFTVSRTATVNKSLEKWMFFIANRDKIVLNPQNNALTATWLRPLIEQNVKSFSIPDSPFVEEDPINDEFFTYFQNEANFCFATSGGMVSRALRNCRYLDDEISDIDLYVFKNSQVSVEYVLEKIVDYLKLKHKTDQICGFTRGKMFTLHIQGVALPLQVSFYDKPHKIRDVYANFDVSHVQIGYERRNNSSVWTGSVYSWVSNIFKVCTFLMHSHESNCIAAARVAKIWQQNFCIANHATQWASLNYSPNRLYFRCGDVFLNIDGSDMTVEQFIDEWKNKLTFQPSHHMKKRKLFTLDAEESFFKSVDQRFKINSRGESETNDSWISPVKLETKSNVHSLALKREEYDQTSYVIDTELLEITEQDDTKLPTSILNVYMIPYPRENNIPSFAGFVFGDLITRLSENVAFKKTKRQSGSGDYENCVFFRYNDNAYYNNLTKQFDSIDEFEKSINTVYLIDINFRLKPTIDNRNLLSVDSIVVKGILEQACVEHM